MEFAKDLREMVEYDPKVDLVVWEIFKSSMFIKNVSFTIDLRETVSAQMFVMTVGSFHVLT